MLDDELGFPSGFGRLSVDGHPTKNGQDDVAALGFIQRMPQTGSQSPESGFIQEFWGFGACDFLEGSQALLQPPLGLVDQGHFGLELRQTDGFPHVGGKKPLSLLVFSKKHVPKRRGVHGRWAKIFDGT